MGDPQAGVPHGIVPEFEHRQDVRLAGDRTAREPSSEDLGKRSEIRRDAVSGLCSTRRDSEARDDLVENQDRFMPAGDFAQICEEVSTDGCGSP